ncbi:MAG TPA: hypothetical protein DEP05_05295 [Betaproteobacteria bacterium]|nr:hypothetical protein [Betaproteobacteria bacterium]
MIMRLLLSLVLATLFLAACGMKGPLYLPPEPAHPPAKTPAVQPIASSPTQQP